MASLSIDDRHDGHDEAKAEAKARHKDIAEIQFRELQYWFGFLDDLLSCELRVWNARLVEWFMREVVVGTILLSWNLSLEIIGRQSSDLSLSMEEYKARAEIRVAIVFFTQLFGMIEYSPLVRMVGAVLLCHKYPQPWCELDSDGSIDFAKAGGFFVVTPAINSLVNPTSAAREEADAGAGVRASSSQDAESSLEPGGGQKGPLSRTSSGENSSELDHRAIETVAAKHNFHQLANDVEQSFSTNENNRHEQLASNRHRTGLLNMIAGDDIYSTDETLLASMLMATILENDAIDDAALEQFGVLPSPTVNDEGDSPFEISIAKYLSQDWPEIDSRTHSTSLANAIECVSMLGMMLLERLVFHTWTEDGLCVEVVPLQHEYNNSKFIQALGRALSYFATQAQTHLDDTSIRDICSDMIKQRYSVQMNDTPDSPRCNESVKMVCSLQSRYPSNFIDNSSVLAGEIVYEGARTNSPTASGGDLFLFNHDSNELKFALQATIHLRSVLGCIQDFHQRITSPHSIVNSRWQGEGEALSFRTTEEADDILLSIGGIQTSFLPEVGRDIDLRGRTFFRCSLPHKFGHKHIDITIDANGATLTVTDKEDLVIVIDPTEIYVVKPKKKDPNRFTVLAVVPLRTIVASATEGNILHIVCLTTEQPQSNIVKDGRLSLKFQRGEQCLSVKECVDKHCAAYEKKLTMDMSDMLDKCTLMGNSNNYLGNSHSQPTTNNEVVGAWCDFQGASNNEYHETLY